MVFSITLKRNLTDTIDGTDMYKQTGRRTNNRAGFRFITTLGIYNLHWPFSIVFFFVVEGGGVHKKSTFIFNINFHVIFEHLKTGYPV